MTYEDYLEIIYNALPMYQRQGKAAYKADLSCTIAIDKYFDHPHHNWHSIHVAGTNGKGSVSHILASVLQEAGYKTGLHTSPHLRDFRERIRINGVMIPKLWVVEFLQQHLAFFQSQKASFFEMTVAMAFEYFSKENVDVAVLETGMGGRLDSTNIVTPLVSLITNIGYDHTAFLGDTLAAIAQEKAGIIKPNVPVVLGTKQKEVDDIVRAEAKRKTARFIAAPEKYSPRKTGRDNSNTYWEISSGKDRFVLKCDLHGNYQGENIVTALAAIDELEGFDKINFHAIRKGYANVVNNTGMAGRWQKLASNPDIYCDVAHNREGLLHVIEQLKTVRKRNLYIVLGMVDDKSLDRILPLFPDNAFYLFTQAKISRALPVDILAKTAAKYGLKGDTFTDVKTAFNKARKLAGADDTIFVGGSTFTVAEIL
ncbi:MAG: bifunctional folylpolyglutamate synthase/dihydrofolate synthase [Bacteroidota bacterium]